MSDESKKDCVCGMSLAAIKLLPRICRGCDHESQARMLRTPPLDSGTEVIPDYAGNRMVRLSGGCHVVGA